MATDRPLAADFELHEFPGWETASELEVQRAEQLVRTLLQPARRAWGRILITSWIRSHSTAHAAGEAVDFVPVDAWESEPGDGTGEDVNGVRRVHGWIATHHPTAYGELLYELPSPGEWRPHIHVTLPGVGGDGEVLTQTGWTSSGRPTWQLGYLVPAVLPLLGVLVLLLVVLLLYAGRGGG